MCQAPRPETFVAPLSAGGGGGGSGVGGGGSGSEVAAILLMNMQAMGFVATAEQVQEAMTRANDDMEAAQNFLFEMLLPE